MSEAHGYRDFSGSTGDDWYFNDRKESALQQRIAELEAKCDRLAAVNERLREALEHIIEYWNRDQNETAMSDALWHIIEVAEAELAAREGSAADGGGDASGEG